MSRLRYKNVNTNISLLKCLNSTTHLPVHQSLWYITLHDSLSKPAGEESWIYFSKKIQGIQKAYFQICCQGG